jgi:hypothetical protein
MQVIHDLGDALQFMARYAGGSVPASTDTQYEEWLGWLNEGLEFSAERGFWSRLLTKSTLTITAGQSSADLPSDFHKRQGIYVLEVDGIDWNEPNNSDGQKLFVNENSDGEWVVNFLGFTPEETSTGILWYFRHPGILSDATDVLVLDGKMTGYYALTEYFRQAGEVGSQDDARAEYNNRFDENLSLDMLPSKQELLSWVPYYQFANQPSNEKAYYTRGRGRKR